MESTRPFESKVVEIVLSIGLFFVNACFMEIISDKDMGNLYHVLMYAVSILFVLLWYLYDYNRINSVIAWATGLDCCRIDSQSLLFFCD
jgi:hypothetical protein